MIDSEDEQQSNHHCGKEIVLFCCFENGLDEEHHFSFIIDGAADDRNADLARGSDVAVVLAEVDQAILGSSSHTL